MAYSVLGRLREDMMSMLGWAALLVCSKPLCIVSGCAVGYSATSAGWEGGKEYVSLPYSFSSPYPPDNI